MQQLTGVTYASGAELLKANNLINAEFHLVDSGVVERHLSWLQRPEPKEGLADDRPSLRMEEVFYEADYKDVASNRRYKVFVAQRKMPLPSSFNTSHGTDLDQLFAGSSPGHEKGDVFFVIQPSFWEPSQQMFIMTDQTRDFRNSCKTVLGAGSGAAIGSCFAPGIGTVIGAVAGAIGSEITGMVAQNTILVPFGHHLYRIE